MMIAPAEDELADQTEETVLVYQQNKKSGWVYFRGVASAALLIAVIAVVTIAKLVPLMIGGQTLWVISGSMDPAIPIGHYAITKPVDTDTLKSGDVITFEPDHDSTKGVPTLHRVNELIIHKGRLVALVTKGDANPTTDKPILPRQVTGKVLYTVPYLGYIDKFLYGTPDADGVP